MDSTTCISTLTRTWCKALSPSGLLRLTTERLGGVLATTPVCQPSEVPKSLLIAKRKRQVGPPRRPPNCRACWPTMFSAVVGGDRGSGRRCSLCGYQCVCPICNTTRQSRPARRVQTDFPCGPLSLFMFVSGHHSSSGTTVNPGMVSSLSMIQPCHWRQWVSRKSHIEHVQPGRYTNRLDCRSST